MEKVIEAAQKAQLHDFVMSLPNVSTCEALAARCSLQLELLQNQLKVATHVHLLCPFTAVTVEAKRVP